MLCLRLVASSVGAAVILLLAVPSPCVQAEEPPVEHGVVTLEDGTRLAWHARPGLEPALVLIPGSWGDYRVFDELLDGLSADVRVIVVELRGHGDSWPPTLEPSMELFADDVLRVVEALDFERYYVGGHSIGGMVAIEIAGRRPEGLAGVISMEGWTHCSVLKQAFGNAINPTMTPEQERQREANRARVQDRLTQEQIDAFGAVWKRWNGYEILQSTPLPVLEIWGDRDAPRPSRELLQIPDRPNIELAWIAGASHSYLIEKPEAVAEVINAFVASVEAKKAATPSPPR